MPNDFPFEGEFEFDISLKLLGTAVKRLAKVSFKYRPDWEYWEVSTARRGERSMELEMEVFIRSQPDNSHLSSKPSWIELNLVEDGVLPERVWERINDEIDLKCKTIDLERRKLAGGSTPNLST